MSTNCKIVKVLCLVLMVLGIAAVALGIASFLGAPEIGSAANEGVVPIQVASVVMAVAGAFELVAGFLGARGANNPAHLMSFIVLSTVLVIVNAGEVALSVMGGSGPVWVNAAYAVLVLVAVLFAGRARREALDR